MHMLQGWNTILRLFAIGYLYRLKATSTLVVCQAYKLEAHLSLDMMLNDGLGDD